MISNIVNDKLNSARGNNFIESKKIIRERENSPDFVDDSSVPPLD